jgi:chromosome segregation ATPase
LTGNTEVLQD